MRLILKPRTKEPFYPGHRGMAWEVEDDSPLTHESGFDELSAAGKDAKFMGNYYVCMDCPEDSNVHLDWDTPPSCSKDSILCATHAIQARSAHYRAQQQKLTRQLMPGALKVTFPSLPKRR